jgi:DNA-binding IclR family transcriptional regulator
MRAPTHDAHTPGTERIEDAIEILSDEYACRLLAALEEQPMPAVELARTCDMSRTTVYRRLDRLESLGFVTTQIAYDPDGHHRKRFHLALDEVRVEVGADGVSGRVAVADATAD